MSGGAKRLPPQARRIPIHALGNGVLHRAIVSLPRHMTERDRPLQERFIFFEAPSRQGACQYLERLLATAWCTDTADWGELGLIYNIDDAAELQRSRYGADETGELSVLECGCGGDGIEAVGEHRVHYARDRDVDVFTTPRVAVRLRELLAQVDHLYEVEPARRKAAGDK